MRQSFPAGEAIPVLHRRHGRDADRCPLPSDSLTGGATDHRDQVPGMRNTAGDRGPSANERIVATGTWWYFTFSFFPYPSAGQHARPQIAQRGDHHAGARHQRTGLRRPPHSAVRSTWQQVKCRGERADLETTLKTVTRDQFRGTSGGDSRTIPAAGGRGRRTRAEAVRRET
jgi:hypothetical protein